MIPAIISLCFIIAVLLLVFAVKQGKPRTLATMSSYTSLQPSKPKHYQHEAMSMAAHEVFPKFSTRLTLAQMDAAIHDARPSLSRARRADRINGMLQTGMVTAHGDGTYSRSTKAE